MAQAFEYFHGIVFARMLHATQKEISIKPFPTTDNASYIVNGKVGIYIKYSSKRLSPWSFSFQKRHQDEILRIKNEVGEVFVLLVCNEDGIVALNSTEARELLNEVHLNAEWISVSRGHRQMYTVKGSDRALDHKAARNDFTKRILEACNSKVTKTPVLSWFNPERRVNIGK
jgi:hypothetical protein